jgi:hypothetical protein
MVIQITTRDCCKEMSILFWGGKDHVAKPNNFHVGQPLVLQLFRPEENPSS